MKRAHIIWLAAATVGAVAALLVGCALAAVGAHVEPADCGGEE